MYSKCKVTHCAERVSATLGPRPHHAPLGDHAGAWGMLALPLNHTSLIFFPGKIILATDVALQRSATTYGVSPLGWEGKGTWLTKSVPVESGSRQE